MKTKLLPLAVLFALLSGLPAFAASDVDAHPSCKYCGMDRAKFAHSRMLIEYENGTSVGTCSIHCAAIHMATDLDNALKALWVGDYGTKNLVDAEKAYWVIGGKAPGVMTRNAKWAFEKKDDAEKFVKEQGGTLASLDDAMEAAYGDMYKDNKMIRERRKQRKMKMMEHKPN